MKKCLLLLMFIHLSFAGGVPEFYGSMKQVTLGDKTITYYRFGAGKPLVLITGHGDSMTMWHPEFLKKVSANHQVIMFDYPGIGDSTTTGNYPKTMDELAQLVQSFIATQKLTKPDLLGFSMGGSLLLYMTTR